MNFLMVRHGEIPSNTKKIYAGRSTERLTGKGVDQVEETAEKLKKLRVHALYSSPIQRAVQTAEIIGQKLRKDYVTKDAFRELELGPWEGMYEKDIARMYPEEWHIWNSMPAALKLPGRETLEELLSRVLTGIRRIKAGSRDNIVIVTHVAIIRVLLLWHAKKSLNLYKTIHVPNAEIFELRYERQS